ncbi:beta-1,4-galactosyltransferase 3-like isoform X9 [Rissa tridactyla]|uniref:beta-1,4-galactosyltransferase 3-like isoform X9 n=1 Tax=Rissa tridactyla TaxID=75485 RepID=UPI0023BABB88|nr:beta-1,4-galactosyltransferase 3-like isoform X9 [Rissa tridactyla]
MPEHGLKAMSLSRVENPCFLLFLFVFQAIFILILYRGGPSNVFRGFLDSRPILDYSKTHDVYTNLSLFTQAPNEEAMPYCSVQSPIFASAAQLQYLLDTAGFLFQVGNGTFNRAKLLNVGVREALKDEDWDCLVLHDVDLVPENDYNLYVCDEYYPKHMASAMDKFQYTLPYKSFFGGVSALTPEHYMKMNGFPNTYWGSGGENDDIATRIQLAGMKIVRTSPHLGRYKVMDYNAETETQEPWRRSASRHDTRKTWKDDGMNSLEFKLLSRTKHPLYTNITVDIGLICLQHKILLRNEILEEKLSQTCQQWSHDPGKNAFVHT